MLDFLKPDRPESLELRKHILREIEDKMAPIGDDRWIFPFKVIRICLEACRREELEGAFVFQNSLEENIGEVLDDRDCPIPRGLRVEFEFCDTLPPGCETQHYRLEFLRPKGHGLSGRPSAKLVVLEHGVAKREYVIQKDIVYMGRLKVSTDDAGVDRRNDLFFPDDPTVSKKHAYIVYRPESNEFWLFDIPAKRTTLLFRENRRLEVSSGRDGGAQLRSADEICLGKTWLRFLVLDAESVGERSSR